MNFFFIVDMKHKTLTHFFKNIFFNTFDLSNIRFTIMPEMSKGVTFIGQIRKAIEASRQKNFSLPARRMQTILMRNECKTKYTK